MSAFVPHAGVAENAGALKALALDKARCVNAALYIGRAFRRRAVFKLLVLKRRSLDDDINAVEQRPGDAAVICAHLVCRAAAAPRRMAVPAAFARIHRTHKHEVCRKGLGPGNARDGDLAVLKRLTQHLKHILSKLRQLIEKQHAVVRKADLARAWDRSAAGHGSARNGMVRRTERTRGYDGIVLPRQPGNGIDLSGFEHFLPRHIRQYAGQALAHHALAGRPEDQP